MESEWAARNGLGRVVIMHPTEPASSYEAQVFRDQFTQAGGQVLDELLFPVGATFFEDLLRQVEELAPDAPEQVRREGWIYGVAP